MGSELVWGGEKSGTGLMDLSASGADGVINALGLFVYVWSGLNWIGKFRQLIPIASRKLTKIVMDCFVSD